MQFTSPFKHAKLGPTGSASASTDQALGASEMEEISPQDMRELLQQQQEAMAAMQAHLDALSVAEKAHVPDLTAVAVEEFLKHEHVASWMRHAACCCWGAKGISGGSWLAVVRSSRVMGNPANTPPGDVLAYRMWNILRESRTANAGRFNSSDKGNADPGNPLDSLPWEQAAASGGQSFTEKGISFNIRQGVLHWLTKRGRWVPVTAAPSRDCQCCVRQGGSGDSVQHWHFQCPQ